MTQQETTEQLLKIAALKTPSVQIYRRNLPAAVGGIPGQATLDTLGQFFYIKEASKPLLYQLDDGRELPFDVGTGLNTRGTGIFKKITIKNIWSEPVTLEIVVGLGEYTDNRFTLVPERDFALPVYQTKTEIKGYPASTIPANTKIRLDGIPILPIRQRKSIVLSNLDAANSLYVLDDTDNFCAACFFGSSITLEVAGPVKIFNNTANGIPFCLSEIWFTS